MKRLEKCSELLFDFIEENPENIRATTSNIRQNKCLDFGLSNFSISSVPSHLSKQSRCKLINTKKDKKYIHQYNMTQIVEHIQNFRPPVSDEYVEEFNKIVDTTIYENCCNCISIVLYSKLDIDKLAVYLSCIYFSVKNIEQFLSDWVIRIYMDSTVYLTVTEFDDVNASFHYQYIVRSPNVEIYTYVCNELIRPSVDNNDKYETYDREIDRSRFLRFLPLIDHNVKTCIIREADGIISALDCHNINVFSKSNKIFYISHLNNSYSHVEHFEPFSAYSSWLKIYKLCIEQDYFSQYHNTYDLLAGMVGYNIKIKLDVFNEIIADAKNKTIRSDVINCSLKFTKTATISKMHLTVGFDEIFLLSLFKGLISCKYSIINSRSSANKYYVEDTYSYQPDELALILSTIISNDTIKLKFFININVYTYPVFPITAANWCSLVKQMGTHYAKYVFDVNSFVQRIKNATESNIDVDEIVTIINSLLTEQIFLPRLDPGYADFNYIFDYITDLLIYYIVRNTNEPVSYELTFATLSNISVTSEWGYLLNRPVKKSLISVIEKINKEFANYFFGEE